MRPLRNVSLPGAALGRSFLFTRDNSIFLEVIGIVSDGAYEATVVGGVACIFCDVIEDGAAFGGKGVGNTRIAAVYHHRWSEVGIGTVILIVWYPITISVCCG